MIMEESRPHRNPIGQDRSGQGLCRHDWRPRCTSRNTQWEPVSTRRLTGHDDYGSVEDRKREGPSTSILETSVVAYQCKTREMAGGGEESEAGADKVTKAGIRYEMADEQCQEGQTE